MRTSSDLPITTMTPVARLPICTSRVSAACALPTESGSNDAPATKTAEIRVNASAEPRRRAATAAPFPVRIFILASPNSQLSCLSLRTRAAGLGRLQRFAVRRHAVFFFLSPPHDRHRREAFWTGGGRGVAAEILGRDAALIPSDGLSRLAQGERQRPDLRGERELLSCDRIDLERHGL